MKRLLIVIFAGLWLSGCGAAGTGTGTGTSAPKLDVKVGGKDSTLNVKSGAVNYGNVISTAPGKPNIQTSAHTIYIASYELDTTTVGWMRKPLTAPDQLRVDIQLTGEDGTKDDSPFKVGTYSAQAEKFNGVRFVRINTFADGKQTETNFSSLMGWGDKKASGEVKITSVTADTVSGEVNLTEGDKSIKGTFTAKLPKK
jgi:hypothetical protein